MQCKYYHTIKTSENPNTIISEKINEIYVIHVLGKTVPEVSSTARGLRPRAVLETEGTVIPNMDRPRPVNNIFIYF